MTKWRNNCKTKEEKKRKKNERNERNERRKNIKMEKKNENKKWNRKMKNENRMMLYQKWWKSKMKWSSLPSRQFFQFGLFRLLFIWFLQFKGELFSLLPLAPLAQPSLFYATLEDSKETQEFFAVLQPYVVFAAQIDLVLTKVKRNSYKIEILKKF